MFVLLTAEVNLYSEGLKLGRTITSNHFKVIDLLGEARSEVVFKIDLLFGHYGRPDALVIRLDESYLTCLWYWYAVIYIYLGLDISFARLPTDSA